MPDPRGAFAVPEAVGTPLTREELARIVDASNRAWAETLQFERMVVISYGVEDHRLRVVNTLGIPLDDVYGIIASADDCPPIRDALEAGEARVAPSPEGCLPPGLAERFEGPVAIVPLVVGDRRVAVLCGQMRPGVSPESAAWQRAAEEVGEKAALVAECQRLHNAYQEALRAQTRTREVAAAILEQRPLPDILALVIRHVEERFGVDRIGVYLLEESGLQPTYLHNIPEDYGLAVQEHANGNPIVRQLPGATEPFILSDVGTQPGYAPLAAIVAREGIHTIITAPLHYGRMVTGALCLYPRDERRFTPLDMGALRLFGDQIALAIAVARFMEQQREGAVLRERTRLAREIHDTLAQALVGIVLQLEALENLLDRPQAAREALQSAQDLAHSALEETRRSVMGLTPTPLEHLELPEALDREIKVFGQQTRLRTAFVVSGDAEPLPPDVKAAVFRIGQETLANIRKHAQAARVRGALHFGQGQLTLIVEDDGVGFDVEAARPGASGGYGLFGMKERARLLGGEVRVESTEGWGTRVVVRMPYDARNAPPAPAPAPPVRRHPNGHAREPQPAQEPGGAPVIRVVVADDHAVTRQGIRHILERMPDVLVAGEAADGTQALEMIGQTAPDVALLDVQMPGMDGVQVLQRLQEAERPVPVIILTSFDDDETLLAAIRAGARAYVLKDAAPDQLGQAIRAVARGESLIDPSLTARLLERLRSGGAGRPRPDLNEREREILALLTTGARNKDIAARLYITEKTVEFHLSHLFDKLDVSNRTEAARYAIEHGLAPPG